MSPKRGDEVPPPAVDSEWRLQFATTEAAKGWPLLCSEAARNARRCWEALRADPLSMANPDRQHPLRGPLAIFRHGGRQLPQWEYEVTSGGRVRYAVDEQRRVVLLTLASTRHPKDTDN